ncbi:helix-turn-helix domain-containing protein [Paeniglutamicibacter kerguelensis]|uniref:Transposase n=1 Tax=Paeniglutamicibacter kerguelensis TaxID=254788 RepID=A0ABS4XIU4_9MICC|nr:helix-turn-helix domain-containing protein [Paeniglutamicibacter kerguelensis]MBP2388241.1 transposase [Paeniglutamicibacter kerguelensis]
MSHPVVVRELENDEEARLLQMVRRGSGSVVSWRRAQTVLLLARGMDVAAIALVAFTSPDRVRDVLHNFNSDGLDSLHPTTPAGGRRNSPIPHATRSPGSRSGAPPTTTWSLSKLADYLVDKGVVDDISHEGLRVLLRQQGVSFLGHQDLENQQRPQLRGKEEPRPGAL